MYFAQEPPEIYSTWELGYVFHAGYQKKGYAAESGNTLLQYAFEVLRVRRIIAKCDPKNDPSWKLLERALYGMIPLNMQC